MRRTVPREAKLSAFDLDLADFESLVKRLEGLLSESEWVSGSEGVRIHVGLTGESIWFDSFEEFKNFDWTPSRIDKWILHISRNDQRITIKSPSIFEKVSSVKAESSSEAWSAGAVETAISFTRSKAKWYDTFVQIQLGWLLFLWLPVTSIAVNVFSNYKAFFVYWIVFTIPMIVLYLSQIMLLRTSSIRVRNTKSTFREYVPEFSLAAAVVAVLIGLVTLFKQS